MQCAAAARKAFALPGEASMLARMDFPFAVVSGRTVYEIVHADLPSCAQAVRDAYVAHGRKESVNPNSYFLLFPDKPGCRIIALPAYLGSRFGVAGIKWIASYPRNIEKGFPRASAVLVLNDYETGYPFAVLESSIISAARTAASAVLAAGLCRRGNKKVATLGIVGTGLIARYVHTFLKAEGWQIDRIMLHDLNPAEAERFARESLADRPRNEVAIGGLETTLKESELLVLTTVAGAPYITDPKLFAHGPVVLNISLRDISAELILGSWNAVDDVEHVLKANTSVHLAEQKVGHRNFIAGTIADLVEGRVVAPEQGTRIVSPFGLGVLDLAVGKWVYDRAVAAGTALDVPDFFFELKR
jgi:N-[(2S)-2-amino-2-carboxyethyl]-L-glutamate dehydrogenase